MPKAIIISPDEIKESFAKYDPQISSEFHEFSAKVADKWLESAMRYIDTPFILLSGGAASGKTEYLSEYRYRYGKYGWIFLDSTLRNFQWADIKIKCAEQYDRRVEIHAVIPKDLKRAYQAFLFRERRFDTEHFLATHSLSRKTLLEIAKIYPLIPLRIIESSYFVQNRSDHMQFTEILFEDQDKKIHYLENIQISADDIHQRIL